MSVKPECPGPGPAGDGRTPLADKLDDIFDPPTRNLGSLVVQKGLATAEQVAECLRVQQLSIRPGAAPPPRLGEVLVQRGILNAQQVITLLAEQQTQIRYCPRCDVQVNVPFREDAALYRCTRCRGPLVEPRNPDALQVAEDSFIVVSRDPVPPEVTAALEDPANRFGKYVLVREIGSGGVGTIYQAWDTFLSQFVALKRMRPASHGETHEMRDTRVRSLIQEARHAIRLRHPGIVSVFDVGRINREYYISMEYLQGETLAARTAESRRRGQPSPFYEDPRSALRLLRGLAEAVHYAHTRPTPIIHCDLKPANVLIDPDGFPHILDFGLARNLARAEEGEGTISGTPHYMAPEQARGDTQKISPRTDVYAAGAILYELIAGRPPFMGETGAVLDATISLTPTPPSDFLRASRVTQGLPPPPFAAPAALESLCLQCLEKEPERRPESMLAVARDLERVEDRLPHRR